MPSLTLVPEFQYDVTEEYSVIESPDLAIIHRRPKHTQKRRVLKLVWRNLTKADKDTLRALFLAVKGSAGEFTYTPVDEVTSSTWKFKDDEAAWSMLSARQRAVELEIREAL